MSFLMPGNPKRLILYRSALRLIPSSAQLLLDSKMPFSRTDKARPGFDLSYAGHDL